MERLEIIARAAAELRARYQVGDAGVHATQITERLCKALDLERKDMSVDDVMLGGAYSRLQLWVWDDPKLGGIIWLRGDLPSETRAYAIAHELGHYVLHRGEGLTIHPPCDETQVNERADFGELLGREAHPVEEYTPRARRELEANAFAAELLAPAAEVRRLFVACDDAGDAFIAARFGISRVLARQRLADAVLTAVTTRTEAMPAGATSAAALIERLDDSQREAARARGPALVVAGPGTGKTATLVGRVAHLVIERGIQPERVLALTFSNRAAGEMRARLAQSGLPGERMPVMTIHAFAANLLREYAARVPHTPEDPALKPDFRILDQADAFLLMEELLADLPLRYYRSLGNPTAHLGALLGDFSRARDGLHTPVAYLDLVERMTPMRDAPPASPDRAKGKSGGKVKPPEGTFTPEQIARARERARAFGVWDRALRRRGLLDFGGLIQRAVELLHAASDVREEVRRRYPAVLVDEFQDTNHAAGELLMLVAGTQGDGLWVVGDRNQSIYRWRGAAPSNLPHLAKRYPHLHVHALRRCYRSVPNIVRLGSAMAARMASADGATGAEGVAPLPGPEAVLLQALRSVDLEAERAAEASPSVLRGEQFVSRQHELAGLAEAIRRHRARGYTYGQQAVLCRTHSQERRIGAALAAERLPVGVLGDFFERPEVKDALALIALAVGPDARGLLRGGALLVGLGEPVLPTHQMALIARTLAEARRSLPTALRHTRTLSRLDGLAVRTHQALSELGEVAEDIRASQWIGDGLASFLLRPGGYAWRLARVADGIEQGVDWVAQGVWPADSAVCIASRAQAQAALAALGELVGLARRFDTRWAREEDFRTRLSRAVMHWRKTPAGTASDPATWPTEGASADGERDHVESAEALAPAVRCFMHYLGALRAADVSVQVPAGEDDAVQVMTLHASKGLEFGVVYLPGLADGEFPRRNHTREEACPPGFRESDAPGERDAEERSLFYVGVTRARDAVVLTRASSYHTGSTGSPQVARPSPLLALLEDAPSWRDAAPLFSDEEVDALLVGLPESSAEDGEDDEDDDQMSDWSVGGNPSHPSVKRTYTLHELQQYIECPRQYKYAQQYKLLDPADNAVYRFHRYVRRGMRDLRDLRLEAPETRWEEAEARLRERWETDGPAGHAYDRFYWRHAHAILFDEWCALATPEGAAAAQTTSLAEPLEAEMRGCAVRVTADRVITDGARDGARGGTALMRLHTGRPHEEDKKDLALPLYVLAYRQHHPDVAPRIQIAYTGHALADADVMPGERPSADVVDVTEEAQRAADKYLNPSRRQRSILDKLDEAAAGIESGRFPPRRNASRCAACPYCYVCPADPEEGTDA
ncbi:MAG TPA: ATP-dependent helicase [Ktedonobacterales bacterium]